MGPWLYTSSDQFGPQVKMYIYWPLAQFRLQLEFGSLLGGSKAFNFIVYAALQGTSGKQFQRFPYRVESHNKPKGYMQGIS